MTNHSQEDPFEGISQESADEILNKDMEPQFSEENKVTVSLVESTEESFYEDVDSKLLALSVIEAYFHQDTAQLGDAFTTTPQSELVPSLIQFNAFTLSMFAESTGLTPDELIGIIRRNLIITGNI